MFLVFRPATTIELREKLRVWPSTCKAPFVYTPRHRWRVEEPPPGVIAENVRAVYEEMSESILVRVVECFGVCGLQTRTGGAKKYTSGT